MICPDCRGNLLPVSVTGFDESYRCHVCGGFFLQGWAVTKAVEEDIDQWSRLGLKPDPVLVTNKCPKDGSLLISGVSQVLPEAIKSRKCEACNWWWMPGDSLFDYRAAMAARHSYFKWWGKSSDMLSAFLPVLLVVIIAVSIAYGVKIIQQSTHLEIFAKMMGKK